MTGPRHPVPRDRMPRDARSAIVLTANDVCLLLALRDFEGGLAPDRRAWARAAHRYLQLVRPGASLRNLRLAGWAMPDSLVEQRRRGRGITARLRPLARQVLAGRVRATVVRHGPWRGFDALVRDAAARRAARVARRRVAYARGDLWGGPADGGHVLMRMPPAAEIEIPATQLDGRPARARYRLEPGTTPDVVRGPDVRGRPFAAEVEVLRTRLRDGRALRYRFAGLA